MYIINLFYLHLQLNCRSDNRHLSSHRFFRHRSFPTDHALACYHRIIGYRSTGTYQTTPHL
jgi:hypothetical protein